MAFFVTARVTQFYCELFQAMGIPVLEMHSRKSQAQRTKAADQFRASKGGCIMFSSDVSARGVDYPDVSLVVQVSHSPSAPPRCSDWEASTPLCCAVNFGVGLDCCRLAVAF